MQQEDDLRGLAKVMEFMRAIFHRVYCHPRLLVLLPIICGYGYKYRCSRQDTPQFPADGGTVRQPADNKSICRHIPCTFLLGNKGRKKSGNDMEQDIRGFPIRVGIVLHELVDA